MLGGTFKKLWLSKDLNHPQCKTSDIKYMAPLMSEQGDVLRLPTPSYRNPALSRDILRSSAKYIWKQALRSPEEVSITQELADELKLMKEQEKTEREQARAQVAQLKKTQDEVCDLSVGLISSLKLLVRAFSIR